jgi:hypothetical protein
VDGSPGEFDVTSLATWSLSALPFGDLPTTAASIGGAGLIVPLDGGNISIDALYNGNRARALRRFNVAPDRDAIVVTLALGGFVQDPATGRAIPDVAIDMLDGPFAGQTRATDGSGHFAFDFFPMGMPFTIRASKPGYDTVTQHHPGITDATPEPRTVLSILLQRRQ